MFDKLKIKITSFGTKALMNTNEYDIMKILRCNCWQKNVFKENIINNK